MQALKLPATIALTPRSAGAFAAQSRLDPAPHLCPATMMSGPRPFSL